MAIRTGIGGGRSRSALRAGPPPVPPLFSFDFTTLAVGAISVPIAGGKLAFSRASTAAVITAATGTGQIVTSGLGVDVPACGIGNGTLIGAMHEESRINLDYQSRRVDADPWLVIDSNCTIDPTYATGVDGAPAVASRVTVAMNDHQGPQVTVSTQDGTAYTISIFYRHPTSSGTWQDGIATEAFYGGTATTAWQRLAVTWVSTQSQISHVVADSYDRTVFGSLAAGARDTVYDLHQHEQGMFPTSPILTSGTQTTRSGTRWYVPAGSAASVMSAGRLALYFSCQPLGAFSEYTDDIYVWYFDASNYAKITISTGQTTIVVGGVSYTTSGTPWTWARGQTLEGFVAAGGTAYPSRSKYRLGGGSWVDQGTSGAPAGALPSGTAVDLLCQSTSNQLSCTMQRVAFYNANNEP